MTAQRALQELTKHWQAEKTRAWHEVRKGRLVNNNNNNNQKPGNNVKHFQEGFRFQAEQKAELIISRRQVIISTGKTDRRTLSVFQQKQTRKKTGSFRE